MTSKKTVFNLEWTDKQLNPQWSSWIEPVNSDPYKARCRICQRSFNLSNMGRQAISSHEHSKKHQKALEMSSKTDRSVFSSFKRESAMTSAAISRKETDDSENEISAKAVSGAAFCTPSILNYVSKNDTLKAEIIWALKLVLSHSFLNSFKDAAEIFGAMYYDSAFKDKVTLGSTKMSYFITHGLAPYFHDNLVKEISSSPFVLCFDEALNKVAQKGQMDLIIRYWPENSDEVQVRFFTSVFLGHSTAEALYEKFCEGTVELNLQNLLQISMDGPYVNLKFWRHINDELKEDKNFHLLNIGTCSLHVIHGAFQKGNKSTSWNLNNVFQSMYRLFKDSPARRADFISSTATNVFPLKFCQIRWVENVKVAERALEVFPHVKKYLEQYKKKLPQTSTVENLEEACRDKLILAKISFFISVAVLLEPFLKSFQSPSPMIPFLYSSVTNLLRRLMSRFVKDELLREAPTPFKLVKIEVSSSKSHRRPDDIDIGIAARSFIKKSGASESEKSKFLLECKDFLVSIASKIIEKSPVNFSIVKAMSCLDPVLILSNAVLCIKRMDLLLQILHDSNIIPALSADRAKQQFTTFVDKANTEWKKDFSLFNKDTKLDIFFSSFLNRKDEFKELWRVVKIILTLSHGNSSPESGFSVNKDILVENMHEESLIAQRTVCDAIKSCGGVLKVKLTPELLQSVKMSRTRYHLALEEKKKLGETERKMENERKRALNQIKLLQQKRARLETEKNNESKKLEEEILELRKKVL